MEAFVVDWLSLLVRWLHLIVGIAWIGASLYFVFLDNHLVEPKEESDSDKGVGGELWAVHGGGFYHSQKYKIAPQTLPEKLHWFKWEAYWTWLSGVLLLAILYWYGAEIYLIDPTVADISKPVAIGIGTLVLIVGWVFYDFLCRSAIGENDRLLTALLSVFLIVVAWGLCQLFSGRGAYIHFGAMLGTIMVANVRFIIIPGQKDLVQAKAEGREPDPIHGIRGKQRSVHNTYFTLPVLFIMISNHYAMTFGHEYNWLILLAITLSGALIRVYFVNRHFGKAGLAPLLVAIALLMGVAAMTVPKTQAIGSSEAVSFAEVKAVVDARCVSCHAQQPTQPGFAVAPQGILLETDEQILSQAPLIHQQTVVSRAMPIGNLTGITEDERALLNQWFLTGAAGE
ncbi:MAG: urate hydroxylase PuuD [Gammaproteobacteria bacterium]|nr:urate hydroxylase PuuD [Gammaproteobacteria bacterium]